MENNELHITGRILDSQGFTNSLRTQWGRLIACLPQLDSVGKCCNVLFYLALKPLYFLKLFQISLNPL